MRRMISHDGKTKLNIVEHIILKNFWEYYITDQKSHGEDVRLAYVMGIENELGYVSLDEIRPYIISRTKSLDILPASGFQWA